MSDQSRTQTCIACQRDILHSMEQGEICGSCLAADDFKCSGCGLDFIRQPERWHSGAEVKKASSDAEATVVDPFTGKAQKLGGDNGLNRIIVHLCDACFKRRTGSALS